MAIKKKNHTKSLEAVQARIAVLGYEIQTRKEELEELANHLADFEMSLSVDIRSLKDIHGIVARGWNI
jgi:predicted RNase H-like nuclease (RuvC/YqgF family)